jgi:hypothetical protein
MADCLWLDGEGAEPADYIITRCHANLELVCSGAEAAARVINERWMGASVKQDVAVRVTDEVEKIRRVDRVPALRIKGIDHRAERLLAATMKGVHLH